MCTGMTTFNAHEPRFSSLIKDNPKAVYDSLIGITTSNKHLAVVKDHCIILRRDHRQMKGVLKTIGGGGAGIEPAEAYYVGKGMLTAAVIGGLHRAPSVFEILAAIRELSVENPDGVLLLVKNYLADKISFGLALEKAVSEDITVKMLLIGDNAFESTKDKLGRKAFAGAALVYKIVGEMAEQGKSMEEIIQECRENIIPDLATVSVTYTAWNNIISYPLGRFIEPDEFVLGIGVYGKEGSKKIKRTDLKTTVSIMLEKILLSFQLKPESFECEVIVLVNNLGALTKIEESVITKEVCQQLEAMDVTVVEIFNGTFMRSQSPEGFSISILKISSPEVLQYLNAKTSAPGWPKSSFHDVGNLLLTDLPTVEPLFDHDKINKSKFESIPHGPRFSEKALSSLKQILMFVAEALISCEKQLNVFDAETGDGDFGTSIRTIAEVFKKTVLNNEVELSSPAKLMYLASDISCQCMGGLGGLTYVVFYYAAHKVFLNAKELTPAVCGAAFRAGVNAIHHYTKAEKGERTPLDVLYTVSDTFESALVRGKQFNDAVYLALQTCEAKTEDTKYLKSAVYEKLGIKKKLIYPDPGCHAVAIKLRAIFEGLRIYYPSESFVDGDPHLKPGIFLWVFLPKDEADFVVGKGVGSDEILFFLEKKIGTDQSLLAMLLLEMVKYCRRNKMDAKRASALLGTFYYTHQYYITTKWRTPEEVYQFFRNSILCQSVESPPRSTEVFEPEEAKNILKFFFESYLRNLPLISIMHLQHYKLLLKIKENTTALYAKNQSRVE